jgi:hypothetical protein
MFRHYQIFFRLIQDADDAECLKYGLMLLDRKGKGKGKAAPLQA